MSDFLANAGWGDGLFLLGLVMIGIAGIGTVLGISGTVYGLRRPDTRGGVSFVLGVLGLAAVLAYAGLFWMVNGDGSWEHAWRHPIFHAVFAGSPFLSGVSAIAVACLRRKRTAPRA